MIAPLLAYISDKLQRLDNSRSEHWLNDVFKVFFSKYYTCKLKKNCMPLRGRYIDVSSNILAPQSFIPVVYFP